jgi:hypothetical protein
LEASQHPVLDCVVRAIQLTVVLMVRLVGAANRSSRLFVDEILRDDNRIIKPVSYLVFIKNHFLRGHCDNGISFCTQSVYSELSLRREGISATAAIR